MAKKINSNYLSNVLKSIKYATIDSVAEMNPVIVESYNNNKGFIRNTIDDLKSQAEETTKFDFKGFAKETYRNFKDDVKSGNFYNKERMKAAENETIANVMGIDLDSLFEDDDYDDDDAYEEYDVDDSESDSSDSFQDPLVMKAAQTSVAGITKGVDYSNMKMTGALGGILVESSNINTKAIGGATAQMIAGISSSTAMVHKDLTALNQNIAGIVTFTNEAMRTHIENSSTFYDNQTRMMQEQTSLLQELVTMQKELAPKKRVNDKTSISDIFGEHGSIDFNIYRDYIKENSSGGGALDLIKDSLPILTGTIKGSPTGALTKALVKKAIPNTLKTMFEDVNDLYAGILGTAVVNLTQARTGRNGAFFQQLGNMFGLKVPDVTKMSTSDYEKGATAWSGKDHKALTVVIPKYLSDIYAAISGKPSTRYDYDTGKFVNVKDIEKKYKDDKKSYVQSANYGINSEIQKQLNKIKFSNEEEKKQILDAIAKVQEYNFNQMKNFNPNSKVASDLDPKTYGITGPNAENVMQIVKMLYTTIDKKVQMKGSTELLESVSKYNEVLREREASGDNIFNTLFDESIDESKIMDSPIMASAKRLDTANFYLEGIWDYLVSGKSALERMAYTEQVTATTQINKEKDYEEDIVDEETATNGKKKKKYDGSRKKDRGAARRARKQKGEKKLQPKEFSIGDDPNKLVEMIADADMVDEETVDNISYTTRIKNAEHASDKLKEFFKGFSLLTNKPLAFMKGALDKVDEYAYSLFFGNGEEDVKSISGKIMKGFDNVFHSISEKVSGVFKAIGDEVKEGGKATANGVFKAIFGIDFTSFKEDLKESLFGDKDASFFSGFGKLLKEGMGEIFGGFFDPIKSIFKRDKNDDIPSAAKGMKVTKTGLVAVSAGERIIPGSMDPASIDSRTIGEKTAIDKFKNKFGLGSVEIDNYAKGGFIPNPETDKRYKSNMTYEQFNAFYETLLTDEEKNYYFAKFSKDYAKRMVKKATKGAKDSASDIQGRVRTVSDQIREKNPALAEAIDRETRKVTESKVVQGARAGAKKAVEGTIGFGKSMKDRAKEGIDWVKNELYDEDEFTDALMELMKRFAPSGGKEVLDDIATNWKKFIPKTIAGGALGAGVSMLTGLAGGPILGAAVGSAIAFASKSTALQKMIFGEDVVDDDGNIIERKDGMFKREVSDAIKKYAPDMTRGGIAGMALTMMPMIPGSPIAGLMIGSAIGYAKNNEELMETLGGTREKLANASKIIKQKLPAMGLGAIAGAVTGPFGLATNLMLGSAIGFASDTEKFKEIVFGYKGLDGKRAGGIVGIFKSLMAPPIRALTNLIDESKKFFQEEVFSPLKKAIKPMFQEIENVFNRLGDMIADSVSTHITKPIGNYITDKFLVPIEKKFLKALTVPVKLGRRAIRTAISPVIKVGRGLERRQLSKIGYGSGTAADRVARREEFIEDYDDETSRIFDPLSNIPGIGKYLARTPLTRTGRRNHKAGRWGSKLQNSESAMFDAWATNADTSTEAMAKAKLLNEALGSNVFKGDKGVKKFAQSMVKQTNLDTVLSNLVASQKIPMAYHKKIINEVLKGECTVSLKLIKNNSMGLMTPEEIIKLCDLIKTTAKKVEDGIKLAETANEEADKFEQEYGFSIRGRNVGRALDKELQLRQKMEEENDQKERDELGFEITEEEKAAAEAAQDPEREERAVMYSTINTIAEDISTIAEAFREAAKKGTGEAQDGIIDPLNPKQPEEETGEESKEDKNEEEATEVSAANFEDPLKKKAAEDQDKLVGVAAASAAKNKKPNDEDEQPKEQYQYTENGIVKLVRNDDNELEVDEQDSDTRSTLKRRDDTQNTQKGILGKLSGIGTSLLDFFSGDKDEKKPSIFSRILSMLGLGFGLLGGSKFLGIAKLVAGGALLSYGIGKLTKKDENGDSIASKIGDKFGTVFGGLADKVGTWWNDTAKPWITEDFIPTTIDGLSTAFKGALGVGGWLFESISTLLVDVAPDIMAAIATGLAKAIWNGIKGIFKGDDEKPDTKEIEGDDKGYKSGETKESINLQTSTNVKKNKTKTQYKTQKNIDGTSTKTRDVQSEIKSSSAYKNIKTKDKKEAISTNESIQEMWDQPTFISDADGNPFTLGELASTPGIHIMDDQNGNPIYSEDILTSTAVMKKVIANSDFSTELEGDYGSLTNEERTENTGVTALTRNNVLIKSGEAVLRNRLTGNKMSLGLLNGMTKARGKEGLAKSWVISKFGSIGKITAAGENVKNVGTAIPSAAVNFDRGYTLAREAGEGVGSALKSGAKQSLDTLPFSKPVKTVGSKVSKATGKVTSKVKSGASKAKDVVSNSKVASKVKSGAGTLKDKAADKLMDIGKIQKDIATVEDVAGNVLAETTTYTSSSKLGNIMLKLKDFYTKAFVNNDLAEAILKKVNKGVEAVSNKKAIVKETVMSALKELVDHLIQKLPSAIGDKVGALASKISAAAGSAGVTYAVSAVVGFITGFKNADAYFEVGFGDVSLLERVAAGILGIIQELSFGIFDAHLLISLGLWFADKIGLKSKDLQERQDKLKEIVDQYNDEYGTNYTPYDFVMDDKIETKIMNGIVKIGKAIGYTAKAYGQSIKGIVWDVGIKGVANAVGSLFSDKYGYENWKSGVVKSGEKVAETTKKIEKTLQGNYSTKKYYEEYNEKDKSKSKKKSTSGVTDKAADTAKDTKTIENSTKDTIEKVAVTNTSATTNKGDATLTEASEAQFAGSLAQISGCTTEELYANEDRSVTGEGYNTVNAFNEGWSSLNNSFKPLLDTMNNDGDKLANMVSKNLAVAMGLADPDEDITLEDILNDNRYAAVRAQMIKDNSLVASITGGVTGSNSNSTTTQDSAARQKLQSTDSYTSTQKQMNKLKAQYGVSANTGSVIGANKYGYTLGGSGSGLSTSEAKGNTDSNPAEFNFVSQNSKKIANLTLGQGEKKQTVSEAGCAPVSAMMAINSNISNESTLGIKEALKTAGGYMATSGGVTADYFADEFGKHGFKAAYVPKKDKNQRKILLHQLQNGISVVLMGKDERNTSKRNSPFGPTYHYVVATGLSEDGKYVYINDPESSEPNLKYPVDNIFNNSELSIVPIKTNGRVGSLPTRVQMGLRGYSGNAGYNGFIYVGDSRTIGFKNAISYKTNKVFITSQGANYSWLKKNKDKILSEAKKHKDYRIIFNLGGYDINNATKYEQYYRKHFLKNDDVKARVYFMSVNPIDEKKYKGKDLSNSEIHTFNNTIKKMSSAKYIDICGKLESVGYECKSDGFNYTSDQYKRINTYINDYFNGKTAAETTTSKKKSTSSKSSDSSGSSSSSTSSTEFTSSADSALTTAVGGTTKVRTISQLIAAIGSMLSGTYGLTSSETSELTGATSSSTSSTTDTGTTMSTDGITGPVSSDPAIAEKQKAVIAKMNSVKGKLDYSQVRRNPENGSGDCSSTVQWVYKKVTGVDVGSYTGAQVKNKNTKVLDMPKDNKRKFDESKMQLGDILLYGNSGGGHVELYYGNGKSIGHGGGKGPKVKNMNYRKDTYMHKRLKDFIPGGKGSGLFVSQNDSKWAKKKIGDENVSAAGCAPAVATMAINNTKKYNMNQAIKEASNYKVSGGGVSADYFVDVFKKQGYNTIILKDKSQILKMLVAGTEVVLIGQDTSNKSKRRSPFGSEMHYVLATGVSNDRSIIYINDPELKSGDTEYNTDMVFKGVQLAIIPVAQKGSKLNNLTKSLREALSVTEGKGGVLPDSKNKILKACATMTKELRGSKAGTWTYTSSVPTKALSFDKAKTNKVYKTNESLFVLWALKKSGLYPESGDIFTPNPASPDGWRWTGTIEKEVKKNFDLIIITGSKSTDALIKSGDLKAGDIVSYADKTYANIYAGNNYWYDGGKVNCSKVNGKTTNKFTDWYGSQTGVGYVKSILRVKKSGTSASKDSSSSSTSSTTIDGTTTTTTGSSSTFLDDLTKQFALLAEGWGLNSLESNTADTTTTSSTVSTSGISSSTKVSGSNNKAIIWNYFHDKGIPDYGIAGMMGNLKAESSLNFNNLEGLGEKRTGYTDETYTAAIDSGKIDRHRFLFPIEGKRYGYGIAQWTDDRKGGLYDLVKSRKVSIADPQAQMDYLWKELNGSYKSTLNAMKEAKSIRSVSDHVLHKFERPADQSTSVEEKRAKFGESIYKEMAGKGSGLTAINIPESANATIRSINRVNSSKEIPVPKNISIYGKGTDFTSPDTSGKVTSSVPLNNYTATKTVTVTSSNRDKSVDTTNALLNAIINLLTQEVKNTAFMEGIANAIVSLVDAKVNSTEDVSTKKQLLDTKSQMLNLMRQQNNSDASTSLSDLIKSVETIIAQ